MTQSKGYIYWNNFYPAFFMLVFIVFSCQATKGAVIRDTAIRKQDSAEFYYKQKDYEKAEKFCQEALASWKQIKDKIVKKIPEWKINQDITRCEYILDRCSEQNRGRLFVDSFPSDAIVRVLDIGPRFHQQGMRLDPGKYSLEVSAPGYQTKIILTELSSRAEKTITVDLQTGKVSEVETKPSGIDKERKSIAEETKRSRDEKELANIPKDMSGTRVSLRQEPKLVSYKYVNRMLKTYNFYDDTLNISGSFANDFVDNNDGTITDNATGLMWQKSGSSKSKTWRTAKKYVKKLNEEQFAGYSDWRLPTLDELASLLLRQSKANSLHIDSVFDKSQSRCWSSDSIHINDIPPDAVIRAGNYDFRWVVDFQGGNVEKALFCIRHCSDRRVIFPSNYVKAVRSAQ